MSRQTNRKTNQSNNAAFSFVNANAQHRQNFSESLWEKQKRKYENKNTTKNSTHICWQSRAVGDAQNSRYDGLIDILSWCQVVGEVLPIGISIKYIYRFIIINISLDISTGRFLHSAFRSLSQALFLAIAKLTSIRPSISSIPITHIYPTPRLLFPCRISKLFRTLA